MTYLTDLNLPMILSGSQRRSVMNDEADGMDETICPSDFQSAGQIVDNDLNRYLVSRPCRLLALICPLT